MVYSAGQIRYNKTVRIFIGIGLDEGVRERIVRELKPFQKAGTPIRWVAPEHIHLTLKFLGEVGEEVYPRLEQALAGQAYGIGSFRLRVRGFGKFPAGSELHVFWAGLEKSSELEKLFQQVEEVVGGFGFPRETRDFQSHITLGRNKARFNFKGVLELLEENCQIPLGEFTVSGFRIYRSQLTSRGPIHTVLKEIALAQP